MQDIGLISKEIRIIAKLYWNQSAAGRTDSALSEEVRLSVMLENVAFYRQSCAIYIRREHLEKH